MLQKSVLAARTQRRKSDPHNHHVAFRGCCSIQSRSGIEWTDWYASSRGITKAPAKSITTRKLRSQTAVFVEVRNDVTPLSIVICSVLFMSAYVSGEVTVLPHLYT
jgi:hypothetical protein